MGVRTGAVALAALVVGSVVAVDPGGWQPFGPARWWVISTLALLGGGLTLRCGVRRLHPPTARLWGGLLTLITVAALVGDDRRVALLGHPVRHLGLATWLAFALVFAAGQQFDDAGRRRWIARAAALAALALGAWALWELVVGRPVDVAANTDRLLGPFGSAAVTGAASALLVPGAVGLMCDPHERRAWRVASAIAAALGSVALVGSGARAALAGVAVAVVVVVGRRRPSRRTAISIAALGMIGIALVAPRLGDVFDRDHGLASRFDEWSLALDVIGNHPLLGVGPEGYRIAAIGAVDAHYEREYGRDLVLPDRAHSGPLDVALDGGLPAAVLYLTLVGWVAWAVVRRLPTMKVADVGLACGVVAYAVQQLVLFPLAELDALWWLFAGMLVVDRREAPDVPDVTGRGRARRAVGTAAATLATVAFAAGALAVAADRLARSAIAAPALDAAVRDADRAVDLRPDDLVLRSVAVRVHLERGTLADVDTALDHADAALRWSPLDPIALDDRAGVLLARAKITGGRDDVDAALAAWRDLVALDPVRARWQIELGRAAALAGDADLARRSWQRALELRPSDPAARALLDALEEA
ncbi:MAG: O-antigen ligase family protein [Acidimicrobiales bacterium]|nr:O-antigen ligase family protein [Acidimicrobiales bacterium]MCB9394742.1 O-antigen ligase family protein [Acidimicrobiaceae bacterium]